MEILIDDLIKRFENLKLEEQARIIQYKKYGIEDAVLILAGKILGINYCIDELQRIITYLHQSKTSQ